MANLSKAEYLKRYISGAGHSEEKRKKRRKKKQEKSKLSGRILDDDVDFKELLPENLENTLEEDVGDNDPTIAEFIDERPEDVKTLEKFRKDDRWKIIGDDEKRRHHKTGDTDSDLLPPRHSRHDSRSPHRRSRHDSDSDISPPRKSRHSFSPRQSRHGYESSKKRKSSSERDRSSLGRSRHDSSSLPRRSRHDSDHSPRRRARHDSESDPSPPRRLRHDSDSDASPPRRSGPKSDSDHSPPRKSRHDSDSDPSPPSRSSRKSDTDISPLRKSRHDSDSDHSLPRRMRHDSDSDASPPRKSRHESGRHRKSRSSDFSPVGSSRDVPGSSRRKHQHDHSRRSNSHSTHHSDSDQSPARKRGRDADQSPPCKRSRGSDSDQSPMRKRKQNLDSDQSPPRRRSRGSPPSTNRKRKSRWEAESDTTDKKGRSTKTMSGHTAGLSSAKQMKEEARLIRQREEEAFRQIGDEMLGKNAKTVFRDKTGKRRNLRAEAQEEKEEEEKKKKQAEKYAQWGKGLKQQEDQAKNIEDAFHEMSKPLARYKDDQDLDEMLKSQDREGDPMLAYIKKKKKAKQKASGVKEMPKYTGPEPPPNRFGIRPGYRWDGVDRSNGFERKLVASKASKKAVQEIAYKWSVEDM